MKCLGRRAASKLRVNGTIGAQDREGACSYRAYILTERRKNPVTPVTNNHSNKKYDSVMYVITGECKLVWVCWINAPNYPFPVWVSSLLHIQWISVGMGP